MVAKSSELEDLKTTTAALTLSLAAADAAMAQLQRAPSQGGEVLKLREELRKAKKAVNLNADFAAQEQARADEAVQQVVNLQNPVAAGGTFSRILSVVKAAALATRSGPEYEWDHVECEALVRTMVEGMVSAVAPGRANVVNAMVVQVGRWWWWSEFSNR